MTREPVVIVDEIIVHPTLVIVSGVRLKLWKRDDSGHAWLTARLEPFGPPPRLLVRDANGRLEEVVDLPDELLDELASNRVRIRR